MCIIVDASVAHELTNKTNDAKPVLQWLLSTTKSSGLVVGGKLTEELSGRKIRELMSQLRRAARLHTVSKAAIDREMLRLSQSATCKSNDLHVVALARESRCTLVYTKDKDLQADLKSHSYTGNPVSIYQNVNHAHLLTECRCSKN